MLYQSVTKLVKPISLLSVFSVSIWLLQTNVTESSPEQTQSYILSAKNYALLESNIQKIGVEPTHKLKLIDALAAELSPSQLKQLQQQVSMTVTPNYQVEMAGGNAWGKRKWQPKSVVPSYIDADYAHATRNFGDEVTIGFLDTGLDQLQGTSTGLGLSTDLYGRDKFWGTYDAINNTISNYSDEENGHGTHVASIAGNADYDAYGRVYGVAPNAALVGIKAFDSEGKATYADVIRGIDWAIAVKDAINLKVLNMSFSGPARSLYWEDPLNIAVMKAWQAGIVVIASAGNKGPDPMTIGVPGNVPYIITVGAMTDNYTESFTTDDKLATFSAAGPTVEGFVKPDLLAPGGHLSGLMAFDTQIVAEHPEFHDGGKYFEMSGTSQAAAVVSGVVALMLTQEPTLTPDDVKCRLMDSAHAATDSGGKLAYSVFQQGAGVVNAKDALQSTTIDCANQAINIAQDLSGEKHFYGPSNIDDNGNFYIEGLGEEYVWNKADSGLEGSGLLWKNQYLTETPYWRDSATTDGLLWKNDFETDGLLWKNSIGTDGLLWKNSLSPSEIATININTWVEQQ